MEWARDLSSWSLPDLSRRIALAPHRWHIQESGTGPTLLLLPGAGASVHTWRGLIPALAETHHVIAIDLPGQGFTQSPSATRSGLEETVADITALLASENWQPSAIIGHSAGAAIALGLSQTCGTEKIVGINPALDRFDGVAGWLFPVIAKLLALNPFTANVFALGATSSRARRLIKGTGSNISDNDLAYYTRLTGDRNHVNGALQMMANWNLDTLLADLPSIETEILFLTGSNDQAVPPDVAERAAARLPNARVRKLDGLGHLAHEEDPDRVLAEIKAFLA